MRRKEDRRGARRARILTVLTLAAIAGLHPGLAARGAEPGVEGEAIQEFFSGSTTRLVSEIGGDGVFEWSADGTMRGTTRPGSFEGIIAGTFEGGEHADTGRWSVERDRLCWQWDNWLSGARDCYVVQDLGDGRLRVSRVRRQQSLVHERVER